MIPTFLTGQHVVYRVFDEADECIYVGASMNLPMRMRAHLSSVWYPRAHRVAITLHPDKSTALAVERAAIRSLRPRYNIDGRGPRIGWKPQDYLDWIWARLQSPTVHFTGVRPAIEVVREEFVRRFPELTDRLEQLEAS